MAVYTEELNTNFNFPNIDIYNKLRNGELYGYYARPQEGYVIYDTTDDIYDIDPETDALIPVTHYFTLASFPLNFNFNNFTWVAVLRSGVDENYIFGGGNDNDHEVMSENV